MQDFLQFKFFIAQDVLIIFYILMAVVLPVLCWFWLGWIVRRYATVIKFYEEAKYSLIIHFVIFMIRRVGFFKENTIQKKSWVTLSVSQKIKFITVYLLIVIFLELFLRLMFEYLLAYMQMHDWMNPLHNIKMTKT